MASKKRNKSQVDWPAVFRRWEASGLSQREFCKTEGLGFHTFRHWRTRLTSDQRSMALAVCEQPTTPNRQPGFVPLGFLEDDTDLSEPAPEPEVTVELPFGVRLRFRGFAQ